VTEHIFKGALDHVEWFLKDEGFPVDYKLATTLVQGLWDHFPTVVAGIKYGGIPCEFILTSMAFSCASMPELQLSAKERHYAFLLHGRTLAVMQKHPGLILYPQDHRLLKALVKDFRTNVNALLETPEYIEGFNLTEWIESLNLGLEIEVFAKETMA